MSRERGDEELKKEALRINIKQSCASNISYSLGDQYMTPAVLALNGTSAHVGVLNALIGLFGPAAQLFGSKLQKNHANKEIITKLVLMQVFLWLGISGLTFLMFRKIILLPPYALIGLYSLIVVIGGFWYPAFFSWLGNLIKKNERGKYFARRGVIMGITGFAAVLLSAWFLDIFPKENILLGFSALFSLASVSLAVAWIYFTHLYAPDKKNTVLNLPWKRFFSMNDKIGRFTLGMAAFNFAIMVASPFFAIYLLQERGYSYIIYTVVLMSNAAWNLLFLPLAGKFSDKYGNAPLLRLSGILFAVSPPLWIFLDNAWLIILIPQLLSGMANAALGIGFSNYVYANVPERQRSAAIAHINTFSGFGVVAGSLLGGFILSKFGFWPNIFFAVFLMAAIFRGMVSAFFLSRLKDVRSANQKIIRYDIIHPLKTIQHDAHIVKNLLEK